MFSIRTRGQYFFVFHFLSLIVAPFAASFRVINKSFSRKNIILSVLVAVIVRRKKILSYAKKVRARKIAYKTAQLRRGSFNYVFFTIVCG